MVAASQEQKTVLSSEGFLIREALQKRSHSTKIFTLDSLASPTSISSKESSSEKLDEEPQSKCAAVVTGGYTLSPGLLYVGPFEPFASEACNAANAKTVATQQLSMCESPRETFTAL